MSPETKHINGNSNTKTFEKQGDLPKLPIPDLEASCRRYLKALEPLQDPEEHQASALAVNAFLSGDGQRMQEELKKYASTRSSYIEEFWYDSYLSHSDPVVLALNPFFVLQDDPTTLAYHAHHSGAPNGKGNKQFGVEPQLHRAASLIHSSLGFIHDLRKGVLEPDSFRGTPLDMYQFTLLFGAARIPTDHGCRMVTASDAGHIVVIRRGQCYYFDVLDHESRPLHTEHTLLLSLRAIMADADKLPKSQVARASVGLLTTENRKIWSHMRTELDSDRNNRRCLRVVDEALFVVCLDDWAPSSDNGEEDEISQLGRAFLCGTYNLQGGVQVGTCTNRWYDKLQIIVCENGAAGINFEHTGVDGHTVLRFAADIYTDALMSLARSINPSAPKMFTATLSPYSKSYKPPKPSKPSENGSHQKTPSITPMDTAPRKLEWTLSPSLVTGIRFAETRLSDLICQNDVQALEFEGYGSDFIKKYGFSPDAFVQMAFQAAWFGLYGRVDCTYEPAMTKTFLHGRTEAIRTVQPESINFTKTFFTEAEPSKKIAALRTACEAHVKLTKECSKGLGHDRHLYALYCLYQNELRERKANGSITPNDPCSKSSLPGIFTDPGWSLLGSSILSTSNCGNPALRMFGFGPTAAAGYGLGYIIRDGGISVCASSKHLQTRRFLSTLESYLIDVQKLILHIYRQANERPAPFVDHTGTLRDAKTGEPIMAISGSEDDEDDGEDLTGYSFFDAGAVEALKRGRMRAPYGKVLHLSEY